MSLKRVRLIVTVVVDESQADLVAFPVYNAVANISGIRSVAIQKLSVRDEATAKRRSERKADPDCAFSDPP